MVNTSKILTVSYGTFSCTLEGFDDSFETMKAIAEYFRDLASDDRYFGAEPPTPDAEMLARIAEREIARRVEAHEEQGKIVLRAGDAPALAAAAAADVVDRDESAATDEPVAEEPVAEVSQAEDAVAEDAVADVAAPAEEPEAPVESAETPAEVAEEPPVTEDVTDEIAEAPVEAAETTPAPQDVIAETAATPVEEPAADEPEVVEEAVGEVSAEAPIEYMQGEEPVAEMPVEAPVAPLVQETPTDETPAEATHAEDETPAEEVAPEDAGEASEDMAADTPEDDFAAEIVAEDEAAIDEYVETAEAFFENAPAPEAPVAYEAEALETPVAQPDAESVAAKLSRIRSVVSQNDQPYDQGDYNEDEHAQDFLNDAAAELDAALAEDDAAELQAAEADETGRDDVALLASLASRSAQQADIADDSDEPVSEEAEGEDSFEDTLSQLLADSISDEETPAAAADHLTEIDLPTEAEEEIAEPEMADEEAADEAVEASEDDIDEISDLSDDDETRAQLNARVVKVKREEFDAAIAESNWDESAADEVSEPAQTEAAQTEAALAADVADAGDDTDDELPEPDQLLSPEQEEDLQRALAEVEADLVPEDAALPADIADAEAPDAPDMDDVEETAEADQPEEAAQAVEAEEHADHETARDGRHKLERADGQTDIERIFDEADSQLEKPESNQRRSAIQHLRAAVAATRAEKKAGADLHKDVDDTPYRSDLASVVRPRRPSASEGARSERPVESRPAPLKLVAEQRVDMEREPIRPRRVSTAEIAAETEATSPESGSSFSDYARQMGATQLPDLLEAAAAYLSDVEGRDQFSRPMLMHKIQEVEKENFAREDGLRSFGQLLREGKIQKIKGGRFTVTEETEFRDQARHAG